jgi:hypothetical protein
VDITLVGQFEKPLGDQAMTDGGDVTCATNEGKFVGVFDNASAIHGWLKGIAVDVATSCSEKRRNAVGCRRRMEQVECLGPEARTDEVRKVIGVSNIVYIVEALGLLRIWRRAKVQSLTRFDIRNPEGESR